jgi:creatinine amidohydrolase
VKLAELTWQQAGAVSKEVVVLVPTGSCEQHGPHLPLFTDSLLATAAAEAVEARLPERVLLAPCVWLGCSGHHLAFAGTLSASFAGYEDALVQIAESLMPHGFTKFFFLNGHGGNTDSNSVACRRLRAENPDCAFGARGYFQYIPDTVLREVMTGPLKTIKHACEAEASLMMHLHPGLVRQDKLRDDGLKADPPIEGLVLHFDELTEEGSYGYATQATAEKGRRLFEAAVEGAVREIGALADGYVLRGL